MALQDSMIRNEVRTILGWFMAFPFLAAWPFLSFFPLMSLLAGAGSNGHMIVQGLLLVSGFWGVGAAYLFVKWLAPTQKAHAALSLGRGAVFAYIITWTVIWFGVRFAV